MTTAVGPMIATLARAKGIPLGDVAQALGIHRNRLTDKMRGRQAFREDEIVAAARFFDVPVGRLFDNPVALLTGVSESAWTRTTAGQRHLHLVAA